MARLKDIIGKAVSGEWGEDDADGNGVPVLRTTNFTMEGVIDFTKVVTRSVRKDVTEKLLRPGDILLEKSGGSDKQPVGRVVFFDGPEGIYLFNNFTALLRVQTPSRWKPEYVFYALQANYERGGTRPYENRTTGIHNLKTEQYLTDTVIPERSFPEQARITAVLDTLNALIRLRKRQLVKLDELVKARFVELFGDPIANPKRWPVCGIKSATNKIGSGATPKGGNSVYITEGISLIRSMNVYNGVFSPNDLAHISQEQAELLENVSVLKNDILFNITGASVARCCIVPADILPARVNQHVCILRCISSKIHPVFLNQQLISVSYQKFLWSIVGGATRQAITKQQIENFRIILPPLDLQERFAAFVEQCNKSKLAIQRGVDKLETLKAAFMGEYFTQ